MKTNFKTTDFRIFESFFDNNNVQTIEDVLNQLYIQPSRLEISPEALHIIYVFKDLWLDCSLKENELYILAREVKFEEYDYFPFERTEPYRNNFAYYINSAVKLILSEEENYDKRNARTSVR